MADSVDVVVARIDERTKNTEATIERLAHRQEAMEHRMLPIENWKANVDAGRDSLSEGLADLRVTVKNWMQQQADERAQAAAERERLKKEQEARDKAAEDARQRQNQIVSRFVGAGISLLFGLMVPAFTSLLGQIPQLHDVRGSLEVIAVLAVVALVLVAILQMRNHKP